MEDGLKIALTHGQSAVDDLTPGEHLHVFQRACEARMENLMPVTLREENTGETKQVRPIKRVGVEPMGDAYSVKAVFYDDSTLSNSQLMNVAHASPGGAAYSAITCLMRAKQSELGR